MEHPESEDFRVWTLEISTPQVRLNQPFRARRHEWPVLIVCHHADGFEFQWIRVRESACLCHLAEDRDVGLLQSADVHITSRAAPPSRT